MLTPGLKIFCSYSHKDSELKQQLDAHLAVLKSKVSVIWSDDQITAGTVFDPKILAELESSNIILLLLSSNHFNSPYCMDREAPIALKLHDASRARVIPILIKPVFWKETQFNKYSILASDRAVSDCTNPDAALAKIAQEINRVIDEISAAPPPALPIPEVANQIFWTSSSNQNREETLYEKDGRSSADGDAFRCVPLFDGLQSFRAAGLTEVLHDLLLQFRGDPGERRLADVQIYSNTNLTSSIGPSGLSEATLSLATRYFTSRLPNLSRGIRGRITAANCVTFLHVPLHELRALPPEERNLRVTNLRLNANLFGNSDSRQIYLYLGVSATTVHPSSRLLVATVGESFVFGACANEPTNPPPCFRQSQSLNEAVFTGEVTEGFSFLLKFSGYLATYEQVGERTRLLVRFSVPAGVALFAGVEKVSSNPSGMLALLTDSNVSGVGPVKTPQIHGHVRLKHRTVGLVRLKTDAVGFMHAAWELEGTEFDASQEVTLGLIAAYKSKVGENCPSVGAALVSGSLAPVSTQTHASSGGPLPRFADSSSWTTLFTIVA